MQSLFKYQSGRVIALGRVMLVTLFLAAILADRTQPMSALAYTYGLLILYAVLAVTITVATWRNWWLDARLAVYTHGVDMAVFTSIVFSTNGSTSPFFLFFVLPLLSAAIRWSWRETALTATVLVVLYMLAGLVASREGFELERFVVRSGYLVILSLLLIWFGIHQQFTRLFFRIEDLDADVGERTNPLERAVSLPMQVAEATGGALLIGPSGEDVLDGLRIVSGEQRAFTADSSLMRDETYPCLLFDITHDRSVTRFPAGAFRISTASAFIDMDQVRNMGATQGLIAEVRTSTQRGWLLLWGMPDVSTDYLEFGRELGRAAGAILDRHALFNAIEHGAAARTRLSLARDVHDSIVQFLAGAAFRTEAIKRAAHAGATVEAELDELKQLLVEEQGEIRGFIMALRRDRDLQLADAVAEIRALAERLSHQWSVNCSVDARDEGGMVPIRLQLDVQQLIREAVANAVRHGHAKQIDIGLAVKDSRLQLSVADNGSGFSTPAKTQPWSLKERVERASGSLQLESTPGLTRILIDLPLAGAAA